MAASPYARLLFAYLIPGSALVCVVLFLTDVPVENGYRISLLEWAAESDRMFPYVLAVGLVASAVFGSVVQALRLLLVDRWALSRPGPRPTRLEAPPQPGDEGGPPPAIASPPRGVSPGVPGLLTELHGNLGLTLLLTIAWVTAKIIQGGGTEVFPAHVAYGVPLAGLAACALLFGAYRAAGRPSSTPPRGSAPPTTRSPGSEAEAGPGGGEAPP